MGQLHTVMVNRALEILQEFREYLDKDIKENLKILIIKLNKVSESNSHAMRSYKEVHIEN